MRVRHHAAMLTVAALALAACGAGADTSSTDSPTASDPAASSPAADATPEASSEPTPDSTPSIDPTPQPEPTPTIIRLTADDLLDGMPTNKQMSTIQGRTFKENDDWVGGGDEGPEWVNDAPLGKRQRGQLSLGGARKTKPAECTVTSFVDGGGLPVALSNQDAITAAGYSKRLNDYGYYKAGNVYAWQTIALVLAPGQAQIWADNFANTRMRCVKYTRIAQNGDIQRIAQGKRFPKGKTTFTSGNAYITDPPVTDAAGPFSDIQIVEAIGDVFYFTTLRLAFDNPKQLAKASKAYNKLADNLATASGVTREPVDLNNLTPFKGDPSKYIPPTEPLSAGNSA